MNGQWRITGDPSRRGFSLLEVSLVAALMSLLMLMLASTWASFGRSLRDTMVRCRVAQEANLVVAALNRDLGGQLPDDLLGHVAAGRMVGTMVVDGEKLMICYDGAVPNDVADWATPDIVCTYELADGKLLRSNQFLGTSVIVSDAVSSFLPTEVASGLRVEFTVSYRDLSKTFTLIAEEP
ncbi:MAG: prepilin-type N-terminal cleavage/methylation domain-containing protein [Planctomycetales bacterium]|nr:prepilin-type N-terminal cleavage/methylation domain-containing protein [Planctomycetales bacterium]